MSTSTTTNFPTPRATAETETVPGPAPRTGGGSGDGGGGERDQCVTFRDVGWRGYLELLKLRGERTTPRMVYLDGTVWLMSLSFAHERLKTRLDHFITEVFVGLRVPYVPTASTTFRLEGRKGGVEGDQTYYIANEERIRGKNTIDLKDDPPPDLAIEAVHTHEADAAVEVYRRFQVPEVWVCGAAETIFLVLQPNGDYGPSATSSAFPFLTAAEVHEWINRPQTASELDWIESLRTWVREVLKPRARETERGPGQQPGGHERST